MQCSKVHVGTPKFLNKMTNTGMTSIYQQNMLHVHVHSWLGRPHCPMVQAYWGGVSHGPGILGRSVPWSRHTGEECPMVQAYWGGVSHGPGILGRSVPWSRHAGEECLASLGSKERV